MNKKDLTTIYIVRHGEAEHNVLIKAKKEFDPQLELLANLTSLGISQAKILSKKFKNVKFDAVFSSDMARAKQTAEIIALEKKIAIQTTNAIREMNSGKNAGKRHLLMEKIREGLLNLSEEAKMQYRYADEETAEEAAIRLITFIREVAVAYKHKTVLIVCHGGIMRKFLVKIGFATYDQLPGHSIENTGYFILESDGVDFYIKETHGINKTIAND